MPEGSDNLEEKTGWGGKREGSGRREGSQNKKTIEKKLVEEAFRQRVLRSINELVNAQMNIAQGCQMLFRIEIDEEGHRKKPELITDQETIEAYLAGELDGEQDYYFITTKIPDNKALDSLLDRVFGKAVSKVELGGADGGPLQINIVNYADNNSTQIPTERVSDTDNESAGQRDSEDNSDLAQESREGQDTDQHNGQEGIGA